MNKRNQYTVMVETLETRRFSVTAKSAEDAAKLIGGVIANTNILPIGTADDCDVFVEIVAYNEDETDISRCNLLRIAVPCDEDEPEMNSFLTPEDLFEMFIMGKGDDENDRRQDNSQMPKDTENELD